MRSKNWQNARTSVIGESFVICKSVEQSVKKRDLGMEPATSEEIFQLDQLARSHLSDSPSSRTALFWCQKAASILRIYVQQTLLEEIMIGS